MAKARAMSPKEMGARNRANNDGESITLSEADQAEALAGASIPLTERALFKGIEDPVKRFLLDLGADIKINPGDIIASPDPEVPRRLILSQAGIYCDIIDAIDPNLVLQHNILLHEVGFNSFLDGDPTVTVRATTESHALAIPQVSTFYDPNKNGNPINHEDVQQLGTNATEGFSRLLAQLNKTAMDMGLEPTVLENLQMSMFKAFQKLSGAVTLPLNNWTPFWPGALPKEHEKLISSRTVMAFSVQGRVVDFEGLIQFMITNGEDETIARLIAQFGNCPLPSTCLEASKLPSLAKVQGDNHGRGIVTLFEAQGLNDHLNAETKPSAVLIPIQPGGEVVIASFSNIPSPRDRLFMLRMALSSLANKTAAMSRHIALERKRDRTAADNTLEKASLLEEVSRWLF